MVVHPMHLEGPENRGGGASRAREFDAYRHASISRNSCSKEADWEAMGFNE